MEIWISEILIVIMNTSDDQYNVEYAKIKNDAFIIRNLALKAKKLKELKIIEDIENRIKNNVEQEIVLLSELLLKISQNI